jgi:alkanesulfonate monooxygenase SsuD/methylene tetrahydromethanopterin reductase-like flavin-dependent oxidoreductase (luciferase family)
MRVLKNIWTSDQPEFHGKFFSLPRSVINAKPVQKPHPPIYIAAFAPAALKRVATMANGWHPTGVPIAGMAHMFGAIRQMAEAAGRDSSELKMIVRANLYLTDKPIEKDRGLFAGSREQVREDLAACEKIGADEVLYELGFTRGGQQLSNWERLLEELKPE